MNTVSEVEHPAPDVEDILAAPPPGKVRALGAARFAVLIILFAFIVVFSLLRPHTFFTSDNLTTIITTQSVLAIVSIALVFPLVVGEFDLSVGANLGLAAILIAGLPAKEGIAFPVALVIALCATTLVGWLNGVMVARVGVNSLVVTLGMGSILSGVVLWYTDGNTLYNKFPTSLSNFCASTVFGVPVPGICVVVIAAVAWFVLEQTPRGRFMHAVGASKEASRLSGINVPRLTVLSFVVSGFISGVAGIVQAGLLGDGDPTIGPSFLLPAFASVFLGATAIRLGVFNVVGTVIAVVTIAVGVTGLQLLGLPFYVASVFQGAALIAAVVAVRILRREAI